MLTVTFFCFAMGWMGGGDAKMASAIALWFGFAHLLDFLLYASVFGGALTLLLIGSFLVGGAAVGTPLTYLLLNMTKAQKDTAEKLFLSQPPANIEKERAVIDVLDKAVTFLGKLLGVVKEVTDGLPNTDTPPASGSNSG